MPRFTMRRVTRPITVEAVQFARANFDELEAFVRGDAEFRNGELVIATPQGALRASPGDWIVKDVEGVFFACKPDVFEQTYSPESDAAAMDEGSYDLPRELRQLEWDTTAGNAAFADSNRVVERHNREIASAYRLGLDHTRAEVQNKTDPMKFACSWCGVLAHQPCVDTGMGRWIGEVHFDRAFHAQECDNRSALGLLATKARRSQVKP